MECRGGSILELSLKREQLVLHTARASAIKAMVELFLSELKKASGGGGLPRSGLAPVLHGALSGLARLGTVSQAPSCCLGWGWEFQRCPWNSGVLR